MSTNDDQKTDLEEASGGGDCYKCGQQGHKSRNCPQSGRGGGGACYRCGEQDHKSRDCPIGGGPQGGEGGGAGVKCYRCGESGHKSRGCPQEGGAEGGGSKCHKCGENGHKMRECPQAVGGGGGKCYRCGESGHKSRECPQGGAEGGGGSKCHKCGETGHKMQECPQGGGGGVVNCYRCGESGHKSRECPQEGGNEGGIRCHKCGENGHKMRECPQGGEAVGGGGKCYRCGESGHKSRECPQGGGRGNVCYTCGEDGHKSRECPQRASGGDTGSGKCYKCDEEGHKMNSCPLATGSSKKVGPNVFVGFQVSNAAIHEALSEVQEGMVQFDEELKSSLIPAAKFHITLLVARIEEENMKHAIQVVARGVEKIKEELGEKIVNVTFEGMGTFGNKIIFANPGGDLTEIKMMRDIFVNLFAEEDICVPDLRFNPHLTIARIMRGRKNVPQKSYDHFKQHNFGTQQVESIQLLSMTKRETEEGYYFTEAEFELGQDQGKTKIN